MITNLGHWQYSGEIPDNCFGFIYIIENTLTGKKYIGKKMMRTKVKLKPLKGKTRTRIKEKETDWRTYTSSSNEINKEIAEKGKEHFKFTIIKLCNSKWELAHDEAKMQFKNDVLLDDNYLNGIINLRIGKAPNVVLEEFKKQKDTNELA